MNFRIVKLTALSGPKTTIYSVILGDDKETLLDHFIEEFQDEHHLEVAGIIQRIKAIGNTVGVRESYFKLNEGKLGDGVCALYDEPERKLRLYGILFGKCVLILGGGGPKPKSIKALQESPKLKKENEYMRIISACIAERMKEKTILWSNDEIELLGDFNFYENE